MSIDEKTIYRKKTSDKFDDYASERLLKLAEITALGINVFGSIEKFMGWMNTPVRPLRLRKPVDLLDTMYGLELIFDEIGRVQHSVYA
jgi:putative toxin-antitoxin system antitoxin component (TIGR02293 family)